jgi:GxxExxY protein
MVHVTMNADDEGISALTERVIGSAFRVANRLGCGFLEKVYENALAYELRKGGLRWRSNMPSRCCMTGWW